MSINLNELVPLLRQRIDIENIEVETYSGSQWLDFNTKLEHFTVESNANDNWLGISKLIDDDHAFSGHDRQITETDLVSVADRLSEIVVALSNANDKIAPRTTTSRPIRSARTSTKTIVATERPAA